MKTVDLNLNQGKRPDQLNGSNRAIGYAVIGLVIVMLLLALFGCGVASGTYTVSKGENIFKPRSLTLPLGSDTYECEITIGPEWFTGALTEPPGFGCKLHCLGGKLSNSLNYHYGGCNLAISQSGGRCWLSARFYEPITEGTYKPHEGVASREIYADVPVKLKIVFTDSTRFYVDGQPFATVMLVPHKFIAPPFLGRSGNDNNYAGGPIPGAFATRELQIKVK